MLTYGIWEVVTFRLCYQCYSIGHQILHNLPNLRLKGNPDWNTKAEQWNKGLSGVWPHTPFPDAQQSKCCLHPSHNPGSTVCPQCRCSSGKNWCRLRPVWVTLPSCSFLWHSPLPLGFDLLTWRREGGSHHMKWGVLDPGGKSRWQHPCVRYTCLAIFPYYSK